MAAGMDGSKLMPSRNNVKNSSNCKYCDRRVLKGIHCNKCNMWIHGRCAQININDINDDDVWFCNTCIIQNNKESCENEIKSKSAIINILNEQIETLKRENAVLKQQNSELQSKISPSLDNGFHVVQHNHKRRYSDAVQSRFNTPLSSQINLNNRFGVLQEHKEESMKRGEPTVNKDVQVNSEGKDVKKLKC